MIYLILEFQDHDEAHEIAADIEERGLFVPDEVGNLRKVYPDKVGLISEASHAYMPIRRALGD